jgi:hypothetical protein
MAVPDVNFIRLASAAESDDPLRDVGFLQKDLMGCERTDAFAMPPHDRLRSDDRYGVKHARKAVIEPNEQSAISPG